jgi:hypothetical protein
VIGRRCLGRKRVHTASVSCARACVCVCVCVCVCARARARACACGPCASVRPRVASSAGWLPKVLRHFATSCVQQSHRTALATAVLIVYCSCTGAQCRAAVVPLCAPMPPRACVSFVQSHGVPCMHVAEAPARSQVRSRSWAPVLCESWLGAAVCGCRPPSRVAARASTRLAKAMAHTPLALLRVRALHIPLYTCFLTTFCYICVPCWLDVRCLCVRATVAQGRMLRDPPAESVGRHKPGTV